MSLFQLTQAFQNNLGSCLHEASTTALTSSIPATTKQNYSSITAVTSSAVLQNHNKTKYATSTVQQGNNMTTTATTALKRSRTTTDKKTTFFQSNNVTTSATSTRPGGIATTARPSTVSVTRNIRRVQDVVTPTRYRCKEFFFSALKDAEMQTKLIQSNTDRKYQ